MLLADGEGSLVLIPCGEIRPSVGQLKVIRDDVSPGRFDFVDDADLCGLATPLSEVEIVRFQYPVFDASTVLHGFAFNEEFDACALSDSASDEESQGVAINDEFRRRETPTMSVSFDT